MTDVCVGDGVSVLADFDGCNASDGRARTRQTSRRAGIERKMQAVGGAARPSGTFGYGNGCARHAHVCPDQTDTAAAAIGSERCARWAPVAVVSPDGLKRNGHRSSETLVIHINLIYFNP